MAKKTKTLTPKLRMIVEFDIEPAEGQDVDEALAYLAQSVGEMLADANGHLYVTYNPDGKPAKDGDAAYSGPFLIGIKVNRQDAVNKPSMPIIEHTSWLI